MAYDVADEMVQGLQREVRDLETEVDEVRSQLALAVAVAEAARWACVAVLDQDTSAADLATIRPMVAEQLLDALRAYDDDRTKRGIVSVATSPERSK